jgi:homoserine O-acetyltransferase
LSRRIPRAPFDPGTGKPYGSRFPDITVSDIIATQRLLLDHLGIEKLVAVVGPSYGGFQAFQWAVNYPGAMKGIAAVVTSPQVARERSQGNVERLLGACQRIRTGMAATIAIAAACWKP